MKLELMDAESVILREIGTKGVTRKVVAQTYAVMLRQDIAAANWFAINTAIIDRWSVSALRWIKEQAWSGKCFEGKP